MLNEMKKLQTEWQHSKNQLYVMCNAAQTLGLSGLAESISSVVTNMDSVISDMKKSVDKSIDDRFSDAQIHSANLLKLALRANTTSS